MSSLTTDGHLWLFGYGSLIWKPPPHYDLRVPGYIEGYVRRFWQVGSRINSLVSLQNVADSLPPGQVRNAEFHRRRHPANDRSEDHRGTPEAPGRVVTLLDRVFWEKLVDEHPEAPELTWGAAYRIPAPRVKEVREYLDIREINGYSMRDVPFHAAPSFESSKSLPKPIHCLVYIGLPDNPQFMGPQEPQALAEHILTHKGPSGDNKDYLYALDTALEQLSKESRDEHVHDLARRCRAMETETETETEMQA